ncbi:hypothetical protein QL285_045563 [Trifolium repens]|nr:hypothetical protein QL285_045563 [Trifolium repens]
MLFMKNNKNTTGGVHPIPKFRRLATANSRFRLTTAGTTVNHDSWRWPDSWRWLAGGVERGEVFLGFV